MNRYLQRRRDRMMRDGRNPYGSRGGYVSSRKRDRAMDERGYDPESRSGHDYGYDMRGRGSRDYMGDEHYGQPRGTMEFYGYGVGGMYPQHHDYNYENDMGDYARGNRSRMRSGMGRMDRGDMHYPYYEDYGYDYGYDYAEEDEKKEYEKKLKEWTEKLKKKDRFGWQKEMVIKRAREMQIKFDEISEDEFYAVYLMLVSDFKSYSNDPNTYVSMAKDWIYDDDIKVSPSEKICIYLYEIVLGEE